MLIYTKIICVVNPVLLLSYYRWMGAYKKKDLYSGCKLF